MSKYKNDGHHRPITESDVRVGVIVRRYETDGALNAFSDSIITGISFGPSWNINVFDDLSTAKKLSSVVHNVTDEDSLLRGIQIHLVRPLAFAHTIGTSIGHLIGTEQYKISATSLLEKFSVIEMSTGELAIFNSRKQ